MTKTWEIKDKTARVDIEEIPSGEGAIHQDAFSFDVGYDMPCAARGADGEVTVRIGSHSIETYTPEEAMNFGAALIRAAVSQGAK